MTFHSDLQMGVPVSVKFEVHISPQTMYEVYVAQGQNAPGHPVSPTSDTLLSQSFCRWYWVQAITASCKLHRGGGVGKDGVELLFWLCPIQSC